MPWKNGGGVTTEIAIFPAGAGLEDFEWRLSMATVASDGPFSLFAGVDRTLAVLEGEGIVLSVEGRPEESIKRGSSPVSFAADRPTSARLIAGPVTDLNAMTRRGVWTHRMEMLRGSAVIADGGEPTIVLCSSGSAAISVGGKSVTLSRHDAAIVDAGQVEAASSGSAELYIVRMGRLS
jgi:environmental stress-induced protein Ves